MARWVRSTPLVLLLASAPARAEPSPAWLERFDVATGCPARDAFEQAVERRVARPLDGAFAKLRLGVSVTRAATSGSHGWFGTLHVTDASEQTTRRDLSGASCPQVIEALSLLAAVAADAASPLSEAPLSTPGEQPPMDATAARLAAEPAEDTGTSRRLAPESARLGPSLYVVLQNAATPNAELGFGAALSVDWPARGNWSPVLQVGAYRVRSHELRLDAAGIHARFELVAAHAVACPLRLPASGFWSLRPCLELDVGQLGGTAAGTGLVRRSDREGFWASSGLSLRGEIHPLAPLSISASFGAVVPWTRHEFYFAPDTEAFRVPVLGFRGALAGALLF